MPKVILEFKLPEEQEEYNNAMQGSDAMLVLWEIDQFLRSKIKYENVSEEQEKIYQEVRDKIWSLKSDRNLSQS